MLWHRVLAVLAVALCGSLPTAGLSIPVPERCLNHTDALCVALPIVPVATIEPVVDVCLNHTDVVLEPIRVQSTVNATAEVIEARRKCAGGFAWNGQECLLSITAAPHCAAGYTPQNGRCERVEDASCPAGYQRSATGGTCKLRVEFNVDCPPAHEWNGENCVHRVPGCPAGYQPVNGQCMKLVQGQCPVGTALELGKCVRTQTAAVVCAPGLELIGDECRGRAPQLCDADYRLVDGACVREQTTGPEWWCRDDMRLEGTHCVSRTTTCPPGYQLNGTRCVNETIRCPANATLDAAGRCVRHVCAPVEPRCDDGLQLFQGVCMLVGPVLPLRCNSTQFLVNGTCVSRCRTLEPTCPVPGAHLDGGVCVVAGADRRAPLCPAGCVLSGGWCVYVHAQCVVVLPECQPSFELRDGRCVRGPDYECLAGFVLVAGRCEPVRPPGVCPVGQHLNGTVCVPDRVPPQCPAGSRLEGQWCVPSVVVVVDPPVVLPPPICLAGYQFRNGTCWQVSGTDRHRVEGKVSIINGYEFSLIIFIQLSIYIMDC